MVAPAFQAVPRTWRAMRRSPLGVPLAGWRRPRPPGPAPGRGRGGARDGPAGRFSTRFFSGPCLAPIAASSTPHGPARPPDRVQPVTS